MKPYKSVSLLEISKIMHRILIVDDHSIVRTGLEVLLSEHLQAQIDAAEGGKEAIKKIKEVLYDLLILDINMPDTDCATLVLNIKGIRPQLPILIFSMNDESLFALHYVKLGASGFLSKNALDEDIVYAVKQILKGKKYINPDVFEMDRMDTMVNNVFKILTERELTVVHNLLKGKNILEISKVMNLHTSTIGTYRTRIFEKLNIKSLVDLTELARIHQFK